MFITHMFMTNMFHQWPVSLTELCVKIMYHHITILIFNPHFNCYINNVEAKYVTPLNIFQVKMKDIFYKHNNRLNPSVI